MDEEELSLKTAGQDPELTSAAVRTMFGSTKNTAQFKLRINVVRCIAWMSDCQGACVSLSASYSACNASKDNT